MTEVSVIIPTYNREKFISECVQSVLAQTLPAREIIIVDDGSTDATYNILRDLGFNSLSTKKTVLRYFFQQNRGVSSARNLGIKEARSEYIALLDSDDLWLKSKLDRQVSAFQNDTQSSRLCHTDEIWIRNGVRVNQHKKHKKHGGNVFQSCLKLCCISPSSAMMHRSVFEDFGFFDEDLPACEDYDFWLRYSAKEDVNFIDEPLIIKKGGHSDQLSGAHWGMDRFRIYSIEKILKEPDLKLVHKTEAIHEVILKLEILINGSQKRQKFAYAENMLQKKQHWEAILMQDFND
jgi:glycosyltransferase involved in cell wall biosynthesis|tara:strand:+ start:49 stop:924 length:876 start_codon:yes stop_codon:yes gene_type:complete